MARRSRGIGCIGARVRAGSSPHRSTSLASTVTTYDDNTVTNGTTYYYQVAAVNAIGETRSTEKNATPSPANGVVLAAAGDLVCGPTEPVTATACRFQSVSDLVVNDPEVAGFLALGDNQYPVGQLDYYQTAYESSYGRVKASTRPVPGNHEYDTPGATGYYEYFGAAAGDPTKGYYSFDVGTSWHLVALNSNCGVVSCAAGSAQEQWLRADLAANSRECVIAYRHQPRFSSGEVHGDEPAYSPFWDALQQYSAEIVLNGHDHDYERFAPQLPDGTAAADGIREFVVGTGGRDLGGFVSPTSTAKSASEPSACSSSPWGPACTAGSSSARVARSSTAAPAPATSCVADGRGEPHLLPRRTSDQSRDESGQ